MKPVYAKRLLKLADFLDTLPKERFDYSCWVGDGWDGKQPLAECETTACALGWACSMPEFRRLGARIKLRKSLFTGYYYTALYLMDQRNSDEYSVAGKIFGLTKAETEFLFMGSEDPKDEMSPLPAYSSTPKQVAKKIRAFVKRETTA